MPVSTKTHDVTSFRCAIAGESAFGTANTTQAEFYELHVTDLVWPDGSDVLADDAKRSDGKMVRSHTDTFRSVAGGTSTVQVSGIATKQTLAMLMYACIQDLTSEGAISPYLKEFEWDASTTGYTSDLPNYTLTFLLYNPSTDNHQQMKSCVVKTLTVESDPGSNGGRLRFTAVDVILGPVSLTLENNATRFGYDTSGDAEGYHLGPFDVTGSVDVKYDANTDDIGDLWYVSPTAGTAEADIFLGYVASGNVKELSFDVHAILTAPETPSGTDRGVFTQFQFQGVDDGTNEAIVVKLADEINRSW